MMVAISAASYAALYFLNSWLFANFDFAQGVSWVYLPAGLRLLLTLVFGWEGALGIILSSLGIGLLYAFSENMLLGVGAGLISGLAPYFTCLVLQRVWQIHHSLENLRMQHLLIAVVLYALVSANLHQIFFTLMGVTPHYWSAVFPMFVGDLIGSLLVLGFFQLTLHWQLRLSRTRQMP